MFSSPAFAQTAAATGFGGSALMQFVPLIAIFGIFYFLMIRPQQRRAKEQHRAMLDAVKKGDEVVTGGGIIGRVSRVQDNDIEVEVAPTVKLRVVKGTLMEIRTKPLPSAANDARS